MAFVSHHGLYRRSTSNGNFCNTPRISPHRGNFRISMGLTRRDCLTRFLWASVGLSVQPALVSNAAMYSADTVSSFQAKGDPNRLETYLPQIEAGYEALLDLQDKWETKTKDYDGDVVRRVLGTVGVKSPLFNIRKPLLKTWQIVAETSTEDALIERLESEWNDVVNGIASIDFQLYSVSFTELTESKNNLLTQGRKALDDTIHIYSDMLTDLHSVM